MPKETAPKVIKPTRSTKNRRVIPVTKTIKTPLSMEEQNDLFKKGWELQRAADNTETARTAANKEAKADEDTLRSKAKELCAQASAGEEDRNIPCEEVDDFKKGIRYLRRMDTGEIFQENPLTPHECQMGIELLENPDPPEDDGGDPDSVVPLRPEDDPPADEAPADEPPTDQAPETDRDGNLWDQGPPPQNHDLDHE